MSIIYLPIQGDSEVKVNIFGDDSTGYKIRKFIRTFV
jgi:hypothetical protein